MQRARVLRSRYAKLDFGHESATYVQSTEKEKGMGEGKRNLVHCLLSAFAPRVSRTIKNATDMEIKDWERVHTHAGRRPKGYDRDTRPAF